MKCRYNNCDNIRAWFSDACTYHKCSIWHCGNVVSNNNFVKCRIHNKCQYEGCNIYTLDQNVCHNHSCKKCFRVVEIGKNTCVICKG